MAELLISVMPEQTRVALTENFKLCELYVERKREKSIVGNIYKGKVVRVMKGMQAVFVDIGERRTAFLYVDEVKALDIPEIEDSAEIGTKGESAAPKIDKILKQGEEIIVQVIKEPRGEKGGRLTCYLTLPGRYLVLLPNINRVGVSRKIEDPAEKKRLLDVLQGIKPKSMGLIARTAAKGKEKSVLESELKFLLNTWAEIENMAKRTKAPCKLYEEIPLSLRAIRDLLYPNVTKIMVEGSDGAYQKICQAIESMAPEFLGMLELHRSNQSLFDMYNINKEIDDALDTKIWLRSGGFLIIQLTEAMTIIDVNSGKYVGKDSIEKTALAINLEAAKVIAQELRKRNLSGIVVVDFIGVENNENKKKICDALVEEISKDRARVSIPKGFSELGLVEFTRQRRYPNIVEMLCSKCPVCDGRGYVKSPETVACEILSKLDAFLKSTSQTKIKVIAHPTVASLLKDKMADSVATREAESKKKIMIEASSTLKPDKFKLSSE